MDRDDFDSHHGRCLHGRSRALFAGGRAIADSSGTVPPKTIKQFVLVPLDSVNYASLRALAFPRSMSSQIVALHVSTESERSQRVREKMAKYAPDIKLVVLDSPYRQFMRPMIAYVEELHKQSPDAFVTIILPEFIPAHWWSALCTDARQIACGTHLKRTRTLQLCWYLT